MRLHRRAREERRLYRLEFVPDPVCWTEVPERLRQLGGQRNRWPRGLVDTLWRHQRMIGNPRYGSVGMLALPFSVVFELLGAFVEMLGYVAIVASLALGVVNVEFFVLFMAVAVMSGVVLSLSAVLLEDLASRRYGRLRELLKLVAYQRRGELRLPPGDPATGSAGSSPTSGATRRGASSSASGSSRHRLA